MINNKKEKQLNMNKLKLILICLFLGSIIGGTIVYATIPTAAFTISSGVYPGAPSYTFWQEGSNYFVKDKNGKIPSWGSGTNITEIWENARDNVHGGSEIKFLNGEFDFTSGTMIINKPLTIIGESRSTLGGTYDEEGTLLKTTSTIKNLIEITSTADNTRIAYLTLQGPSNNIGDASGKGIYATYADSLILEQLYIYRFSNDTGIHIEDCSAVSIRDIQIRDCYTGYDIRKNTGGPPFQITLERIYVKLCQIGAYWKSLQGLEGSVLNFEVCNEEGLIINSLKWSELGPLWFEENNEDNVADTDDLSITGECFAVSIHDVILSGTNTTHGIDLGPASASYNSFSIWNIINYNGGDVVLRSTINHIEIGYVSDTITNSGLDPKRIFWRNKNYVNSGIETISSSTSVTFNHGLKGTPDLVLASFNSTSITGWKWTATSTQITITVNPTGTYAVYWYAEYYP